MWGALVERAPYLHEVTMPPRERYHVKTCRLSAQVIPRMQTTLPLDIRGPPRDSNRKSRDAWPDVATAARKQENEAPGQLAPPLHIQ